MGLDQYLFKVKKKCATEKDLEKLREIRSIFEDQDKLKYYDEVNAGKYENYLEAEFVDDFITSVKLGLILKEKDLSNLNDNDKIHALDAADKFLNVYVPELQSAVKSYTEAVANGETVEDCEPINVGYWRKHSDLQGYMEDLYRDKGGTGEFNCVDLILSKEDCEDVIEYSRKRLQRSSQGIEDEHTTGFFFGETQDSDWADTIDIFNKVLAETDWENETVYYSSWW